MGLFFNQSKDIAANYLHKAARTEQSLNNSEQIVYKISGRAYLDYLEAHASGDTNRIRSGGQSYSGLYTEDDEHPVAE